MPNKVGIATRLLVKPLVIKLRLLFSTYLKYSSNIGFSINDNILNCISTYSYA